MEQPRKITRDEFVSIFGMQPEDFAKSHPDRVTRVPSPEAVQEPSKVAPRRYGSRMGYYSQPENRAVVEDKLIAGPSTPPRDPGNEKVYESTPGDLMPEFMQSTQKNIVAGGLALPGTAAGFADLVRIGVPAVARGIMSDDEEKSLFGAIADEFSNAVIPPEIEAELEGLQTTALEKFRATNPNASPQEQEQFIKEFAKSDEFYEATVSKLPTGLNLMMRNQTWANEVTGLGKRADQMTAGDEAIQAISSAFVGLPTKAANAIGRRITSAVGERIANNVIARATARAAEIVTPLTLPLTPGNVALNAGAGVALGEIVREVQEAPTLIDYQRLYDPDNFAASEALAVTTGITAAGLFSAPGIMRAVRKQVQDQITADVKSSERAGPALEDQVDKLDPVLSPTTGMADQASPLMHGAQKFGANKEAIADIEATYSGATTAHRVQSENNLYNYGMLDDMPDTIPIAHIDRAISRLSPEQQEVLSKYMLAVQRQQDSAIYESNLIKQVNDLRLRVDDQRRTFEGAEGKSRQTEYNRLTSLTRELNEATQKYSRLINDDPTMRSSMRGTPEKGYADGWSRGNVETFIKAGESVPEIKQISDAMRKVSHDVTDYLHNKGVINAEEAARRKRTRDMYFKLQQVKYPNVGRLRRSALLFRDRFKERDINEAFYTSTTPRNVTGDGAVVNVPRDPFISFKESMLESVRAAAVNSARRDIIDTMDALPGARGKLLRPYEFNVGNGRKVTSISQAQFANLYPNGIKNQDDFVKVFRNGNVEFWRMSDASMTRALQYAPLSAHPILNASRKFWQSMTTGPFAPWFAAKTFVWDPPLAQTTKQAGRSLGLIDTLARRLVQGTALERPTGELFDRLFDPTAFLSAGIAIPYQVGLRAAKALGDKIATDLATHSGVFNAIANSSPQGAQFVRGVGMYMSNAFDRSALGAMSRNMTTSISHMNDVSTIYDDFSKAIKTYGKYGDAVLAPLNAYKAVLESVHMATRTAFFASNYGRLRAKYGEGNIPKAEIKKLVQETKNLTGDMSRQSNSKFIQELTSVIPYSNAMIQGTRHILSSAVPQPAAKAINVAGGNILEHRDTRFWSQFTTGLLIPKIGALAFLANWEGAEDYWYNQMPTWEQMSHIPLPKPEVIVEAYTSGKMPKFSPELLHKVPISPEFVTFLEPAISAMQAMGMIGQPKIEVPMDVWSQIKNVADHITGFASPPVIAAIAASQGYRLDIHSAASGGQMFTPIRDSTHGGANADMMTHNSDIPMAVYEVIGALGGSAVQIAMQTYNVFDISMNESGEFSQALSDALDTGSFEVARRMPNVPNPGLWDSRARLYAFTPESQYVYQTLNDLDPIIGSGKQLSVERDRKGREAMALDAGLLPARKLKDQDLLNISELIHGELKQDGPFKTAQEMMTDVRSLLTALEASRFKWDDDKYNDRRNIYIARQHELIRVQSQVLQELERKLQTTIGPQFEQRYGMPFTYNNLSKLVRKDVSGR